MHCAVAATQRLHLRQPKAVGGAGQRARDLCRLMDAAAYQELCRRRGEAAELLHQLRPLCGRRVRHLALVPHPLEGAFEMTAVLGEGRVHHIARVHGERPVCSGEHLHGPGQVLQFCRVHVPRRRVAQRLHRELQAVVLEEASRGVLVCNQRHDGSARGVPHLLAEAEHAGSIQHHRHQHLQPLRNAFEDDRAHASRPNVLLQPRVEHARGGLGEEVAWRRHRAVTSRLGLPLPLRALFR
mmetsp:Transcript_2000/g.4957  ORF Transcript_2000/g.4957 Transcript_2000/m.4957 type:complete len:240 (+) Transcript_2000:277-996(+)